jgi:lipopolysaccharide/colanic/teichoic acid biosynthesis glycosyltransferase
MLHAEEENAEGLQSATRQREPGFAFEGKVCSDAGMEAEQSPVSATPSLIFNGILLVLERVFALFMLIATAPLMCLITVAIRLDSPGPAIFTQRRVARIDKKVLRMHAGESVDVLVSQPMDEVRGWVPTFTMYKFRTYHNRPDKLTTQRAKFEFDAQQIGDVHLQLKDDPRITRVGRFLRRTSLDELPNFINVLRGEMRLIGPRPEVPEMIRYYTAEQLEKFTVKPGITGLAQVNGRGKLNFKETLNYDLRYVHHHNWAVDLRILLKTIRVVLTGDGSF